MSETLLRPLALDLKFFLVTLTCAVEETHMSCACEASLTQP